MKYSLLGFLLLFVGCATTPPALTPISVKESNSDVEISVVSHGRHTGIVVDAKLLNKHLPELESHFGNPKFYEIGWGDAGFYKANQITTGLTLHAIFWPTPTVLHIVSFNEDPQVHFSYSEVVPISIYKDNNKRLFEFIESSFEKNDSGNLISEGEGIYGDSEFFKGTGRYYLFNTCNKWTAKALFSAGMDVNTFYPISATSVMKQIRK
ncbi:MAG: TIGR02117 family protein [Opitutaceae bacterium]